MCKSPSPPPPVAPPAPTPVRSQQIEAREKTVSMSRRAAAGGNYESMMLTGPGGVQESAPVTQTVLGG
jgi:hypothetical protein